MFNLTHGRYRFLYLPFGLICAHDIFQKKVDETFSDLPGITDDIVIHGNDLADHNANLKAVMECARKTELHLNVNKCKLCTQIPFFGLIVSASGFRPDPQKVDMINNMDPFTSLAELQPFLGMTHFLSRYVPNLASHSAALWDLTKGSRVSVRAPSPASCR